MNENILKFKCFKPRGVRILKHIKKWLARKIKRLKSNFELVGRKYVRCFIAVQNFKKFD